jgi:hypothetical protein
MVWFDPVSVHPIPPGDGAFFGPITSINGEIRFTRVAAVRALVSGTIANFSFAIGPAYREGRQNAQNGKA